MSTDHPFQELIPGFPDDVAVECLSRAHYSAHHHASSVSRSWRRLFHSSDFYRLRSQTGHTRLAACLVQAMPDAAASGSGSGLKPARPGPPGFGVSVFDPVGRTWDRVGSFPTYPDRLPLFCHVTSYQGKLILMGGWDPDTYDPVTDVFIYDFRTTKWARGSNMPTKRSLFAIGSSANGRVLVAGGHDESKNALNTVWSYDVDSDKWSELARMSEPRDECSGLMIGPEFWVVSGYETANQGGFKNNADVYDTSTGEWRKEDDVWDTCHSPRSVLGAKKDGELFSWAAWSPEVQAGTCAVELGNRVLVSGSEEYGSAIGFFLVEEDGEMKKVDVPDEFKGFVQSACCVEI